MHSVCIALPHYDLDVFAEAYFSQAPFLFRMARAPTRRWSGSTMELTCGRWSAGSRKDRCEGGEVGSRGEGWEERCGEVVGRDEGGEGRSGGEDGRG